MTIFEIAFLANFVPSAVAILFVTALALGVADLARRLVRRVALDALELRAIVISQELDFQRMARLVEDGYPARLPERLERTNQ